MVDILRPSLSTVEEHLPNCMETDSCLWSPFRNSLATFPWWELAQSIADGMKSIPAPSENNLKVKLHSLFYLHFFIYILLKLPCKGWLCRFLFGFLQCHLSIHRLFVLNKFHWTKNVGSLKFLGWMFFTATLFPNWCNIIAPHLWARFYSKTCCWSVINLLIYLTNFNFNLPVLVQSSFRELNIIP